MLTDSSPPGPPPPVDTPWAAAPADILERLSVAADRGLAAAEAKRRLKRHGPNRLREPKPQSAWVILGQQFRSLIVGLLGVGAIVSFAFGDWLEGVAILVVILINAAIGFFTELRAVRSMEALRKLGHVKTKVRRGGEVQEIRAQRLVPGDIVVLEAGDIITADLRVLEASRLQADESALTGESVPVTKTADPLPDDTPLAERASLLYKGTALTRGAGAAVVVATGMHTELGQISSLVEEAEEETTPLEKRLDRLGHRLIGVTLVVIAIIVLTGLITRGFSASVVRLMVQTGIALAVAAIPEGLPIVATLALARGMFRMAKRNALVNRLAAVQTLGSTSIICTDKTGTLTENRMTVVRLVLDDGPVDVAGEAAQAGGRFTRDGQPLDPAGHAPLREAIEVGVLCNDASLAADPAAQPRAVGEPLEVALLACGRKAAIRRAELVESLPEVREEAFDNDTLMMATCHQDGEQIRVAVKGAPEAVLAACTALRTADGTGALTDDGRARWAQASDDMASGGLRIIGLAAKTVDSPDAPPYEGLVFLGLVGLQDPPRADVRDAITSCRGAGIRVVMVTGDQAPTARAIGRAVGLIDDPDAEAIHARELDGLAEAPPEHRQRIRAAVLFARVTPKQKLDLIGLHQQAGAIVAMTGDGVNDAPALKKADIGVAMGLRGTQVAREAADMVLKDDAFATIVAAVEQGRVIFANIRRFAFYLLSCNFSEILTVFLASLVNAPLPILPLQILFLNLATDIFPALALGACEGDPDTMSHPPRDPREPILTRAHWVSIVLYGLGITACVLGALALAKLWLKLPDGKAVTISFLTLAFAQLWHVFNLRERASSLLRNDITRNRYIWAALALCTLMLVLATCLPVISTVLRIVAPSPTGWLVVLVMSLLPTLVAQILLTIRRPRQ